MRLFKCGLLLIGVVALAVTAEEEFDAEILDGEDVTVEEEPADGMGEIMEGDDEDIIEEDDDSTGAPDIDIASYFPDSQVSAGKASEVLVSVKVAEDAVDSYTFHMIEGGFHYPQDWGYKVQNFSSIRYTRELSAGEQATFMYPFMAAELAGGRSYGLQLNLHYTSNQSPPQVFSEAFYNETVEVAENMDNATAEQFFMFLTMLLFGTLAFVYFAAKVAPKKKVPAAVEIGTSVSSDSSWIPREHIKNSSSPPTTPNARRRKAD